MSELFDKFKNGDERTIYRIVRKGQRESFKNGETLVFKQRCRIKVTQRWNDYGQCWKDDTWHNDIAEPAPGIWTRLVAWVRRKPIPKAKVVERHHG